MFKRFKKVHYDMLIPPLNKPFSELTAKEAETFFVWYTGKIPERIEYLSQCCARQLRIDVANFDLSPQSLIPLWHWFLDVAQTERTPKRQLEVLRKEYQKCPIPIDLQNYMLSQSRDQFSLQTEYILRDIGMYIGAVFVKNKPSIHWGFYGEPKTDCFTNKPVLIGFVDSGFNPPFNMVFEPIHMVGVQASNIWDGTQHECDLYDLYQRWLRFVPVAC